MRVKKLKIKNFRRFNEAEFDFAAGVNVVQGLNETGKSTLSLAILTLLFGDPATKAKQFFDQYSSWDQGGSIFLQAEGTSTAGDFQLTKDFGLKLSKLVNLTSKKEATDVQTVQKAISNLLGGIASQKVFESTAFIKQSEIAKIEKGSDFISAIQKAASASGMEGGIQDVLKKIDKELLDLKKGLDRPTNNPGKIKALQMELAEVKKSLDEMRISFEKIKAAVKEEKTSKGGLEDIKEKINFIETQLENNKKFKESSEKIKGIEQQIIKIERHLSEVSELTVQINSTEEKMKAMGDIKGINLEELALKVGEMKASINAKKQSLEKLQKDEIKRDPSHDEPKESKGMFGIFGGILLIIASIVLFFVVKNALLSIALGAVGMFGLAIGIIAFVIGKSTKVVHDKEQENNLKSLAVEIEEEQGKLTELLGKYKFKNTEDFYTSKAKISGLLIEKSNLEATMKGMLGGRSLEEIKTEQAELLAQKKAIEVNELTEDVKNSGLTSEEYLRRRRELDTLKMEERRLMQMEAASKVRVEDAGVSSDNIVEAEENLEMIEEELAYYEKRRKVLELTRTAIEETVESTAQDAGKVIRDFVKIYLPKITQDRYIDIKVEKDLTLQVFSKEKGDWVDPVGNLSSGTIDQIYFLTRLAFLKLVAKDANPPIILDDPFVTFDKPRRQSTKEILHEIAKDHQVILLTHSDDYREWGNVVEMK